MLNRTYKIDLPIFMLVFLAIINYGRIYLFNDVIWDDNCWLQAAYSSNNLEDFLNAGFYELRRVPFGIFQYYLFSLHKYTDFTYVIWHSLNIFIQILTPVFLYLFLNNLSPSKRMLSFFAATSFIIFPLDNTLPYLTVIAYRMATFLTVLSFYLTERALAKDNPRKIFLIIAFILSGFSHYVFMEITIVFETARLFVIGYIFNSRYVERTLLIKKSLYYWLPFFLLCVPLVIYKLLFKPYGIYEGIYKTDFFFMFNKGEHSKIIKLLLFQQWKDITRYITEVTAWPIILSTVAVFVGYVFLRRLYVVQKKTESVYFISESKAKFCSIWYFIFLGILFLIPPIMLLEFSNRETSLGFNTSHFNQAQIGYAIVLGSIIYLFYSKLLKSNKQRLFGFVFVILLGTGTFFNNLNIDLYFKGWEKQKEFWQKFTDRFPSLPENAVFMMDVRDWYYHDNTDLDNTYDLEPALNILYNDSTDPKYFRKYKAFAIEEFRPSMVEKYDCSKLSSGKIERTTHFGKEVLDPCKFIVIYYREGELLVNREIIEKNPDIIYKNWANKDFPKLPLSVEYPLRYKLEGFTKK